MKHEANVDVLAERDKLLEKNIDLREEIRKVDEGMAVLRKFVSRRKLTEIEFPKSTTTRLFERIAKV